MIRRSTILAPPLFGLAMASSFAALWLGLGRAGTTEMALASLVIAIASAVSCGLALLAGRLLRRRPWSARFAAALILLITGTAALTSASIGAHLAWTTHPLPELSPKLVLVILAASSVAALYGFLSIPAFLILPLGLPLILATAAWIAQRR
jgi:hypothetical protein